MCKIRKIFVLLVYVGCINKYSLQEEQHDLMETVKMWAINLGKQLHVISEAATRRNRVIDSFKQTRVFCEPANKTVETIADKLKVMMAEKEKAVKKIVERAELLSYYRKAPVPEDSTYDFYNADNITNSTSDPEIEQRLYEDMLEREHQFRCELEMNSQIINNNSENMKAGTSTSVLNRMRMNEDDQPCYVRPYIERKRNYFRHLPLIYHPHFTTPVNLNFSSVRVGLSIYSREEPVLNDIRWSEGLDLVFKENYRDDPTLIWQYFAGASGFLRHYPGLRWSDEKYDDTFEFRTRAWFLEAISSPKDVIILMDMTGSMWFRKWNIAKHLVNSILDTLGDNDYVNVYLFNNETHPLVNCFNYTLMQAHEENLRLLRESLDKFTPHLHGNMKRAFRMAFATLEKYRQFDRKAHCNQIIMFISEGIDYDYDPADLFGTYDREEPYYTPVRVFTFLVGTEPSDEVQMSWIACANMGYYVNVSIKAVESAEKVLKYLSVLSRPLNMNNIKPEPIWTGGYVDLADRRLTNWLWNKHEGNIQRDRFVKYTRDIYKKYNCIFDYEDEDSHFLLKTDHEYEIYLEKVNFTYMTTVSLPVYDLRPNKTEVLGVAGVDVPIDFIKKLTMPHRIGVNGYAFILTNNGLLLLHPDHRKEFQNNIKPTFNRVDLTEAEIVDDLNEPRNFNKEMLEMREKMVQQMSGYAVFNVKTHIDKMKRIILSRRHYYYTKIGPFSLGIALPDGYGFCSVKYDVKNASQSGLRNTINWKIHPEWLYCKHYGTRRIQFQTPEEELIHFLSDTQSREWTRHKYCYSDLVYNLIADAKATEWFEDRYAKNDIVNKYQISLTFLATHSGLTRWKNGLDNSLEPEFIRKHHKATDEVWYKRSVDFNYQKNQRSYLYSVPFAEDIDLNAHNKTFVTGTHAVFRENQQKRRAPVAVVGFQFNHFLLESIFRKTTSQCGNKSCRHTCDSDELTCFILDNNAFVLVSDEGHTGEFIGDIRPDIMKHMVENGIYKQTRFVDYQDICYLDPPKPQSKSPAPKNLTFFGHFFGMLQWIFTTIIYFAQVAIGAAPKINPCLRAITSDYDNLSIRKTLPTPCDRERWLYTLGRDTFTGTNDNMFTRPECLWPYIVQPIPDSNLILLVVNAPCSADTVDSYPYTPEAVDLKYNLSMPCYIATKNNYTRRQYIACINKHEQERTLNVKNKTYCGITW